MFMFPVHDLQILFLSFFLSLFPFHFEMLSYKSAEWSSANWNEKWFELGGRTFFIFLFHMTSLSLSLSCWIPHTKNFYSLSRAPQLTTPSIRSQGCLSESENDINLILLRRRWCRCNHNPLHWLSLDDTDLPRKTFSSLWSAWNDTQQHRAKLCIVCSAVSSGCCRTFTRIRRERKGMMWGREDDNRINSVKLPSPLNIFSIQISPHKFPFHTSWQHIMHANDFILLRLYFRAFAGVRYGSTEFVSWLEPVFDG